MEKTQNEEGKNMALIKCPECGREVSDMSGKCPGCGYPIQEEGTKESSGTEQKTNGSDEKKGKRGSKTKKIIAALIGASVVIAIIAGIGISSKNAKIREQQKAEQKEIITYNEYVDKLNSLYSQAFNGASDAEAICVLTGKVWTNSIYGKSDEETDKYTAGAIDFNAAIQNIYNDEEIKKKLDNVRDIQEKCSNYIQALQSCPDELGKCYDAAVQLNTAYTAFAELALSPSGNLTSYRDSESKKAEELLNAYNTLGAMIPAKKEVPLYDDKGDRIKDEFAFEIYLNQKPDKLPDTVDDTMAKIGLDSYKDSAVVCGEEGTINYTILSGTVGYIHWTVETPGDTTPDKLLEKLRERYGKENTKKDNTYLWNNDKNKDSVTLKVESDKVSISWLNIKDQL